MTARKLQTEPDAPPPLSPQARIERAKRLLAESIVELVAAQVEQASTAAAWVDQNHSPLGKRRHLSLVRSGALKGSREGILVFVRRAEIDAYLARKQIVRVDPEADEEQEVSRLVSEMSRKW